MEGQCHSSCPTHVCSLCTPQHMCVLCTPQHMCAQPVHAPAHVCTACAHPNTCVHSLCTPQHMCALCTPHTAHSRARFSPTSPTRIWGSEKGLCHLELGWDLGKEPALALNTKQLQSQCSQHPWGSLDNSRSPKTSSQHLGNHLVSRTSTLKPKECGGRQ